MWSVSIERHHPDRPFRFSDLLTLQERELGRIRGTRESSLLFAELPPTLTLGARQGSADLDRLRVHAGPEVDLVPGQRGGNETWHGPGQWVGFVLTSLESFTGDPRGVRAAVMGILERVKVVAQTYRSPLTVEEGDRLGIWTGQGKLVSIGIKIREGYTTSGFALNSIPDPRAFSGINPCGISGALPDFLFAGLSPTEQEQEFLKLPHRIAEQFIKS
jgi:lipoyl(octanoyl) transferase